MRTANKIQCGIMQGVLEFNWIVCRIYANTSRAGLQANPCAPLILCTPLHENLADLTKTS